MYGQKLELLVNEALKVLNEWFRGRPFDSEGGGGIFVVTDYLFSV